MAQKPPILVMDDDPELCQLIKRSLEHAGHKVVVAQDGMHALGTYEMNRPSMLFVDLMMPNIDGEEFLRMLGTPRPPVVLITASVRRLEVANRFGVDASLEKPFDIREIMRLANEMVGDPKADEEE